MDLLRHLTADVVVRHFDGATLARAREVTGRVVAIERRPSAHRAGATYLVEGSSARPYLVRVRVAPPASAPLVSTDCSCPVARQCKHGAAAALALAGEQDEDDAALWQEELADLLDSLAPLAPSDEPLTAVALRLSWEEQGRHRSYYDTGPLLRLRPMRRGKRERWIKSGLGWTDVGLAAAERRHPSAQLDVLQAMVQAIERHGRSWYAGREPTVGDLGPQAVPLLLEARAAGITFLLDDQLSEVVLAEEPWQVGVDLARDGAETQVRVGLEHDGRWWSGADVRTWGDPAHTALLGAGDGRIVLGRLARPLPRGPVRALTRSEPLRVPGEGEAALRGQVPRLRRLLPVASRDDSVEVPGPVVPVLRLQVRWEGADRAHLTWSWRYADTLVDLAEDDGPATAATATEPAIRDRRAERELLAGLPSPPEPSRREVSGVDALHLSLLELSSWRGAGVEVVETDPPRFREAEQVPEISFAVEGTDDGTDDGTDRAGDAAARAEQPPPEVDWLDLSVSITADGERFPLASVLAALTLGEEHVVLRSGLFVRTDHPAFARLHELVRAAAEVHDADPDRVRIGRNDLSLWAELRRIGIVDRRARAWAERAEALRDLVELPRPDPTGVVSTLRAYQLEGFRWLAFLWQHGLGGVLADDMGLGKTLQVLTLVAHSRSTTDRPFLVVAPTSVVGAWAAEAARHTPGLRVRTIRSSGARRGESIADLAAAADIVVTSYTLLRLEVEAYHRVGWEGLVLDEAQFVKNHRSQAWQAVASIEARFRLAVTGTPFENRLSELWALLAIVAPGLYPRISGFSQHVARPVERYGDTEALQRFRRRIRPLLLRRTKEQVATDLPGKQEQVLAVELSARHRRVYEVHLARERQRILGLLEDFDSNQVAVLAALTRLRQLALDPALVDPGHGPIGSAKTDVLVEHAVELVAGGHRALVFSTFTGFLRRVRQRLEAAGVATAYLDGTTTDRDAVIAGFRGGEAPVFLISLKAGGVGLTLTEADYVFVLDPWWNPAAEAQAVDRAHRIGQRNTVMVYRLVATGTIEEKVLELQQRKADLFRRVVDTGGAAAGSVTAEDVRTLLE